MWTALPRGPMPTRSSTPQSSQLGELYTLDKLNRALENIRQLMQENGYYRARVTAESTSNAANQQTDILFHVSAGSQAHVGEVKVTGSSSLSLIEVQDIAHMNHGDRVTASRVSDSLQRLRKRFQKQNRALAQVSIANQTYHPETNAVDFTFQIDPGPVVVIFARGFHISRGTLKREIPVYEENAVDDDLLNEGKRNLLDYLQTRGHFDAKVEIRKRDRSEDPAGDLPDRCRTAAQTGAGGDHRQQEFSGYCKAALLPADSARQPPIEPRALQRGAAEERRRHFGRTLSFQWFPPDPIETKVDDNYQGTPNKLAVHIHIEEGVRTRVGDVHLLGNQKVKATELPR